MTRDRDHEIFDAVVMAGETCSTVAKRIGLCAGRVGAIVFEVARRRNPHEYKRIVMSGDRSLRAIRANAPLFPRSIDSAPKCAEGVRSAMREAFESALTAVLLSEGYSAYSAQLMFDRGCAGEYRSIRVNGAWWGWQASRDSVVVELPESVDLDGFATSHDGVFQATKEACRAVIEAQGLKVKA